MDSVKFKCIYIALSTICIVTVQLYGNPDVDLDPRRGDSGEEKLCTFEKKKKPWQTLSGRFCQGSMVFSNYF